jgi:hypothetical protein
MSKLYLTTLLLVILGWSAHSQSFLQAYQKHRTKQIDSILHKGFEEGEIATKKQARQLRNRRLVELKQHLQELDTIFHSIHLRRGFDFNKADSIYLIYQTPNETPHFSDIIIWSGKDTVAYSQEIDNPIPYKYGRKVVYKPFKYNTIELKGFHEVNDRDTLLTLAAKRDYATALKLSEGQQVIGGAATTIVVAFRNEEGYYQFEGCHIPPFFFKPVYRKE